MVYSYITTFIYQNTAESITIEFKQDEWTCAQFCWRESNIYLAMAEICTSICNTDATNDRWCMGTSVNTQKHWLIQIEEAIIQCMAAPSISTHYNNFLCSLIDKGKNGTATFSSIIWFIQVIKTTSLVSLHCDLPSWRALYQYTGAFIRMLLNKGQL